MHHVLYFMFVCNKINTQQSSVIVWRVESLETVTQIQLCSQASQATAQVLYNIQEKKKKKHLVLCHDPNATTILPDKLQFVSCSANLQIKLNLEKKKNHRVCIAVTFIIRNSRKEKNRIEIEIISTVAIIKTDILSSLQMHFTSLKCQIWLILKHPKESN